MAIFLWTASSEWFERDERGIIDYNYSKENGAGSLNQSKTWGADGAGTEKKDGHVPPRPFALRPFSMLLFVPRPAIDRPIHWRLNLACSVYVACE